MGHRLATIDVGQKVGAGAVVPLSMGEMLGPHLTQRGLGRWPTSILSGILIHPAVWPQYTNVTNTRQTDRTDIQRSDSIGRTVLQTVARRILCQKGAQPLIYGPCLLWPNGWMDQNAT